MSLTNFLPIKRRGADSPHVTNKKIKIAPPTPTPQTSTFVEEEEGSSTSLVPKRERERERETTPTPTSTAREKFIGPQLLESPSQLPAYQRYASLVHTNRSIPNHYKILIEKFRCTDTVVSMLQKRGEVCTLSKLKKAVQAMMRRAFEQRNLAQIKTVFPSAFTFRQEKDIPADSSPDLYQLTIESTSNCFDPAMLLQRMETFRRAILNIVIDHHTSFLNSRCEWRANPGPFHRWHPGFDLENIPDVEEAELPKPPLTESYTTAKDMLAAAAHGRFSAKVKMALTNASSETYPASGTLIPPPPEVDTTLAGVSPLLLERIRQKEAAKQMAVMTRDPAVEKKLCMMEQLPNICRIVRTFFISEQKTALSFDEVVAKISDSCGVSKESIEYCVHLLGELLPDFIHFVSIRHKKYVKINKTMDITTIIDALGQKKKALFI